MMDNNNHNHNHYNSNDMPDDVDTMKEITELDKKMLKAFIIRNIDSIERGGGYVFDSPIIPLPINGFCQSYEPIITNALKKVSNNIWSVESTIGDDNSLGNCTFGIFKNRSVGAYNKVFMRIMLDEPDFDEDNKYNFMAMKDILYDDSETINLISKKTKKNKKKESSLMNANLPELEEQYKTNLQKQSELEKLYEINMQKQLELEEQHKQNIKKQLELEAELDASKLLLTKINNIQKEVTLQHYQIRQLIKWTLIQKKNMSDQIQRYQNITITDQNNNIYSTIINNLAEGVINGVSSTVASKIISKFKFL